MFIGQCVGIDVYVLLFGVVENLGFFYFEHEFLGLFLDFFEDCGSSGFFAFEEDDGVERGALGKGGEVDLLLFLFGWHL